MVDEGTATKPSTAAATNRLTRRWTESFSTEENCVCSGVGAWLVLAAALSGAEGDARRELEGALSISKEAAAEAAGSLAEHLRSDASTGAALGLWIRKGMAIHSVFVESLAPIRVDTIPEDSAALDRWVEQETGGLIDCFPGELTPETLCVLMSALVAEADWIERFESGTGRWRRRSRPSAWLYRSQTHRDHVAQLRRGSMTVSRVLCETKGSFDVHLLGGSEDDEASGVLGLGIDALREDVEIIPGPAIRRRHAGGCLEILTVETMDPAVKFSVSLPQFDITSHHDLLQQRELFGLTSATDTSRGHFPEISDVPLAIEAASQSAMAGFSAHGFRAAAVSAIRMRLGAAPSRRTTELIDVRFDRAFGFLVVDRTTRIVLFAGWVADVPPRDLDELYEELR